MLCYYPLFLSSQFVHDIVMFIYPFFIIVFLFIVFRIYLLCYICIFIFTFDFIFDGPKVQVLGPISSPFLWTSRPQNRPQTGLLPRPKTRPSQPFPMQGPICIFPHVFLLSFISLLPRMAPGSSRLPYAEKETTPAATMLLLSYITNFMTSP